LGSCQFGDASIDVVGRGLAGSLHILLKVGPHQPHSILSSLPADRVDHSAISPVGQNFSAVRRDGRCILLMGFGEVKPECSPGRVSYSCLLSAAAAASALFSLWIRS